MGQSEHDRRRSIREIASHRAVLLSAEGDKLAEGMTTNLSDEGAFVVVRTAPALPEDGEVILEVDLGEGDADAGLTGRHRCRVVRYRTLGNLSGLGVEFIDQTE